MMNREEQVEKLTTYIAHFTDYIGKHLPDDVKAKISELAEAETNPLAKSIYETMNLNQRLASELNRPSCQDTGVIQFWVKCGTKFPLIDDLEVLLKEAVVRATVEDHRKEEHVPLRVKKRNDGHDHHGDPDDDMHGIKRHGFAPDLSSFIVFRHISAFSSYLYPTVSLSESSSWIFPTISSGVYTR